ncbi:MAG: arginine--tRNA ligase [Candidatus Marsarchaeota archaeon]|nr:arginine--tRNA ligase [Candidatus Marsarchaeota archaeon]
MAGIYFYDLAKDNVSSMAAELTAGEYSLTKEEIKNSVDFSKFADLSCSVAFKIAEKQKGLNPNQVAAELKNRFDGRKPDFVERIDAKGGFLNFYFDRQHISMAFARAVAENMRSNSGFQEFLQFEKKKEKVIIEYPSVNPNKPWHLGHLRNALLGDAISNLFQLYGFAVERQDYIDDLGLQMVESVWGYLHLNDKVDKKFDQWLGEEYVQVNKHIEANDIKQELDALSALIEQDGTYESNLARKIALQCLTAQYETAFSYSLYHDVLIWESDIVRSHLLEKSMDILQKGGFIQKPAQGKYANCTIIDFNSLADVPEEIEAMEEKAKVLIRSNGAPTYLAKDIAFHMWKFGIVKNIFKYKQLMVQPNSKPLFTSESVYSDGNDELNFGNANKAINIIDSRQSYLQTLIKVAFNAIGRPELAFALKHLSYGEVVLEAAVLSGRKGTWMGYTADLLLEQAEQKARSLIKSKFELSKDEYDIISKAIAVSAIKFEFLKQSPEKKIIFSWDNALNFNANSGPYAQYTYARASRIIEKASSKRIDEAKANFSYNITDYEFDLIKEMSKIRSVIEKSVLEYRPSVAVLYANELCILFTKFYENVRILDSDANETEYSSRLALVISFKYCMDLLFSVIGLVPLNKM